MTRHTWHMLPGRRKNVRGIGLTPYRCSVCDAELEVEDGELVGEALIRQKRHEEDCDLEVVKKVMSA